MTRVGLIGAGLIGGKRAAHMKGGKLIAVCDRDPQRAQILASAHGAQVESSYETLVQRPDIDSVIISTTNNALAACAIAAVRAGKHVLMEKPAAREAGEVQTLIDVIEKGSSVVRVGFNHRFHPAFQKAKQLLSAKNA